MADDSNNNNEEAEANQPVTNIHHNTWYIRKKDKITGPFPSGQISQLLVVGRLTIEDEVSHDKDEWSVIRDIPSLIPNVLTDNSDGNQAERLAAARRWADERREERRDDNPKTPGRHSNGRRDIENSQDVEYRHRRESIYKKFRERPQRAFFTLFVFVAAIITVVWSSFNYSPLVLVDEPNCTEAARKGVNWRNCNKPHIIAIRTDISESNLHSAILREGNFFASNFSKTRMDYSNLSGGNFSYAVFEGANLKGSNLQNTDLRHANFSSANLNYVDFTGSNVTNVNFSKADLSHAIWIDGDSCQQGSIGYCRK